MDETLFRELFTDHVDVVFAFHGYPGAVHQLVHGRPDADRFRVRGFIEEGTTTTPFDMVVRNKASRYHLVMDALNNARRTRPARAISRPGARRGWPSTRRTSWSTSRTCPTSATGCSATGPSRADTIIRHGNAVYVASAEGYTGKSAVALGVLEQLSRRVGRVGVFRPVVRADAREDHGATMSGPAGLPRRGDPVVRRVRRRDLRRRARRPRRRRSTDRGALPPGGRHAATPCVVVGSDYTDVGAPDRVLLQRPDRGEPRAPGAPRRQRRRTAAPDEVRTTAAMAVDELHGQPRARCSPSSPTASDRRPRAADAEAVARSAVPGIRAARGAAAERPLRGRPHGRLRRHAGQRRRVAARRGRCRASWSPR